MTKEVTLIPSRHTLLLVNTPTLRMLILIPSRTHNTSQQTHKVSFNRYKDYTCYRMNLKSIQAENPSSHSLIKSQSLSNLSFFSFAKSVSCEKPKSVFLFVKQSCLLSHLNKLYSLHLKIGQSIKNWSVNSWKNI